MYNIALNLNLYDIFIRTLSDNRHVIPMLQSVEQGRDAMRQLSDLDTRHPSLRSTRRDERLLHEPIRSMRIINFAYAQLNISATQRRHSACFQNILSSNINPSQSCFFTTLHSASSLREASSLQYILI